MKKRILKKHIFEERILDHVMGVVKVVDYGNTAYFVQVHNTLDIPAGPGCRMQSAAHACKSLGLPGQLTLLSAEDSLFREYFVLGVHMDGSDWIARASSANNRGDYFCAGQWNIGLPGLSFPGIVTVCANACQCYCTSFSPSLFDLFCQFDSFDSFCSCGRNVRSVVYVASGVKETSSGRLSFCFRSQFVRRR